MAFDAFGEQTFAAALTPTGEGGAAPFRFHAGAKAVLAFASALGRLIGAFHKAEQFFRRDFGAVTLRMCEALSIAHKLTVDLVFAHCPRPTSVCITNGNRD
jgi:hypothetical protein